MGNLKHGSVLFQYVTRKVLNSGVSTLLEISGCFSVVWLKLTEIDCSSLPQKVPSFMCVFNVYS